MLTKGITHQNIPKGLKILSPGSSAPASTVFTHSVNFWAIFHPSEYSAEKDLYPFCEKDRSIYKHVFSISGSFQRFSS